MSDYLVRRPDPAHVLLIWLFGVITGAVAALSAVAVYLAFTPA